MNQFGLIGYPIGHSLSPWIHERLLKYAGLQGNYHLFEITPEDNFEEKINEIKQKADGFNVTIPYKQKIIPYLDELDDVAKAMGAVNTVVYEDGKWTGHNTDGIGYLRSLKNAYPKLFEDRNAKILILGAGGAARAIYYALASNGFHFIDIANRTVEKAQDIASSTQFGQETKVVTIEESKKSLHHYDVIIQTTSVGMKNTDAASILTMESLKSGAIVSDIVYQPIETRFLKEAKEQGANILYGHTMLLYQAQAAFEIWTGVAVDVTDLETKLLQELKGR